jgi:pimeloyl-ACP methyl ester carboxylesterase
MQRTTVKKTRKWLLIIISAYIIVGAGLYFFQEKILFHPVALAADHQYNFSGPFKEINLPLNNEKNLSIIQFTVPDSLCKGVVLYFHGNRKNIERYAPYAKIFTKNSYEVWMIDYPGFGKSTGKRSEEIMYEDAATLYHMARARFSKDSILIYGKSLGTGIASQLASVRDCKQVILETPYYSIDALMRHYAFIYPVSRMAKYHFPNYEYLKKIEAPVTFFHGTKDAIIPYKHSLKLLRENSLTKLVTIEKGKHNNLYDSPTFQQHLDSLLQLP